jgi:hypothetical protein
LQPTTSESAFSETEADGAATQWLNGGEIEGICALWNRAEADRPWLEIYVDHFSGVDFRFSNACKGYEQVMTAMEVRLLGFSRDRAEAVGSWEEEQRLPVVWRRDLVAQPFESRLPEADPRDPTPVELHVRESVRNVTIAICALRLGRELEADELRCVHTDLKDGKIQGAIAYPLSETLTRRQTELNDQE